MGKIPLKSNIVISFLLLFIISASCQKTNSDIQQTAEHFVQTYYIQISPKDALNYARGHASEKLNKELVLLSRMIPSHPTEQPQMTYKILSCQNSKPDLAECAYELKIQSERLRIRRGKLTLQKSDGHWWVTEFIEEVD